MIFERTDSEVAEISMRLGPTADGVEVLTLDAFSYLPEWTSRISGLGGPDKPADTSYVFRTSAIRLSVGPAAFRIKFFGLNATTGTMVLYVASVSEIAGSSFTFIKIITLPLAELQSAGEECRIEFQSRRNMLYAVAGHIYDETDASAAGLTVTVEHRAAAKSSPDAASEHTRRLGIGAKRLNASSDLGAVDTAVCLINVVPPSLADPVSQGMTTRQCSEPPFGEWLRSIGRIDSPTEENWEFAYVLQVLNRYGAIGKNAAGMGFGGIVDNPLPSLLAKLGCAVVAAAPTGETLPGGDPGIALEQLHYPQICGPLEFFDRVHFAVFDVADLPAALAGYDFVWSIRMSDRMELSAEYQCFVERLMDSLRPGGLAVHIFRQAHATGRCKNGKLALARPDIERIALSLISRGHQVAQLKFGYGHEEGLIGRDEVPYGLIVRRGIKAH